MNKSGMIIFAVSLSMMASLACAGPEAAPDQKNLDLLKGMIENVQKNSFDQMQALQKQLSQNLNKEVTQLQKNIETTNNSCNSNIAAVQNQVQQMQKTIQGQMQQLQKEIQDLSNKVH